MRIIFLPDAAALVLCFIVWLVFQTLAAFLCSKMPDSWLSPDMFLYRTRNWEKGGKIYKSIFRINKWKKFLPDSGSILKGTYKKKELDDFSEAGLKKFLRESCRAELTHWLAIPPFIVFGLFTPPAAVPVMFVYAVAVNMPCILAQRYNRPRIQGYLANLTRRVNQVKIAL
jgi:glycosyl-4,4'-diaponeurosporenoate acyltransferase